MKYVVMTMAGVVLAGAGFVAGRLIHSDAARDAQPMAAAPTAERKPLYWHDPMVPGPRFDKPGKSPFMDMQLVPVYAGEGAADNGVAINPAVQQNLGIRTAAVTKATVSAGFDAIGTVQFDERLTEAVQTRVAGYVERLAVRAPMERVSAGQALATVFAPEWLAPQGEYLALRQAGAAPEIVAAARERLRALSVPDALVKRSEAAGTAQARFTVSAPVGGVVAELGVREGVAVTPGLTLFRIAGLQRVWAVVEVPEAQALRLKRGQPVQVRLQADEGQAFSGRLQEILPQVNAATRTLQARFEVDNRAGLLVPGMLLKLNVSGAPGEAQLLVPTEAVIRTGTRAVVIVRHGESGPFEPREVKLGAEHGDRQAVREGLAEGEQVVVSGQFLVDSEARLKSVLGALSSAPSASPAASSSMGAMP